MPDPHEKDELRLCPVCRMPISILATRCRHCGEEVGRPRKEVEKLSIQDLGGETDARYTVSGNVMDALETFRAEVLSKQEEERQEKERLAQSTWFSSKKREENPEGKDNHDSGLPELDEQHRELADTGDESTRKATTKTSAKAAPAQLTNKLFFFAAIAAGLVLLYLGTDFAVAKIKDYLEQRNAEEVFVYENRALAMLEEGGEAIEALGEAMEALKFNHTDENLGIAEQVRARFIQEVDALRLENPYRQENLDRASMLASRALLRDGHRDMRDLLNRVDADVAAYKVLLTKIDTENGRATFRVSNSDQTVAVGDRVADRFIVVRISTAGVALEDSKVKEGSRYRRLMARLVKPITASAGT